MSVDDVIKKHVSEVVKYWNDFETFLECDVEYNKKVEEIGKKASQEIEEVHKKIFEKQQEALEALMDEYYEIYKKQHTSEDS